MAARDLGSHKSDWAQPSKTSLVALTLTEHDWKNKNSPKRSGDKRRSYMGCDGVLSNCGLAPIWKLLIARQALQPSRQHLTRWSSTLDCHHGVNSSRLRWSPTAQSTGMLFSSWASWAGDWWRRPGMFEHLRFYSNGFPLWCNVSIRFCCMMVSLMTTGQRRVHFQTRFVVFFCNFRATRGFPPG